LSRSPLGSPARAQMCAKPPSCLVSWWAGNGNAQDMIGGNHGTLQNGATFAPGIVGQAFHFDGVDDYVDVGSAMNLQPRTQSYSVEAWARTTALGGQEGRDIYGNNWAGSTAIELRLNAANRPEFLSVVRSIGSGVTGTSTVNDGSWHHWVGVVDVFAGKMRLYIDGALDAEADYTVVDLDSGTDSYQIGARQSDNFWQGDIDEVSFYNCALTACDIQTLFEAGSGGKCTR
jgi:hypothetical protein